MTSEVWVDELGLRSPSSTQRHRHDVKVKIKKKD